MKTLLPLLGAALAPAVTGALLGASLPGDLRFEVLPSTRRVTALLPHGARLLVGTTGGLVVADPDAGTRRVLLPGVPVRALAPAPTLPDAVWVASDAGLDRVRLPAGTVERFLAEPTQALWIEPGAVWSGHPAGRVRVREGTRVRELQAPTASPVHSLLRDRGQLLAASVEGLWRQEAGGLVPEPLPGGALSRNVTRLEAVDGRILAGTPQGLYERHAPGRWTRVDVGDPVFVTDLAPSSRGLLAATAGDGIRRLGPSGPDRVGADVWASWIQGAPLPPDLGHTTALAEHRGVLYAGTMEDGLYRLGPRPGRVWDFAAEPPGNTVTALAYADHHQALIAGSFELGVGVRGPAGWRHFQAGEAHLTSSWINQVASDGERVLVRFSNGQVYTRIAEDRFRQLGAGDGLPKNWTSAAGTTGRVQWIGTQNAFYLRDPGDPAWQVHVPGAALQGKLVLDVEVDGPVVWLATHRHGVLRWDRAADSWHRFTLGSGLEDPWVTSLALHRGELWAGTFHGGLARLPAGSVDPADWQVLRAGDESPRVPSDGIQCLLPTAGGLWIGTFGGLTWTDGTRFRTYGPEHGLPSKSILSLTSGGGSLWVGTDAGLARTDWKDMR